MRQGVIYIHHIPEAKRLHTDPRRPGGWHPANCWCEPTVSHKTDLNGEHYIAVYHQKVKKKSGR